jgi:hypothetical protein
MMDLTVDLAIDLTVDLAIDLTVDLAVELVIDLAVDKSYLQYKSSHLTHCMSPFWQPIYKTL